VERGWTIERMYHTVVNATDLDRSVAFYRALGFEILNDRRTVKWPDYVARVFGLERAQGRGVLMNLPADPQGPMMDIIEWVEPKAAPIPQDGLGVPRIIAFRVKNVRAAYDDLKRRDIPLTAFIEPEPKALGIVGVFCARDPDGTLIELIELQPGVRHSRANETLAKT
jgi:catechol 2,3-dioxygenase-like lactoylglutathione lyase family enzyme